jgi:hypothetical protein
MTSIYCWVGVAHQRLELAKGGPGSGACPCEKLSALSEPWKCNTIC